MKVEVCYADEVYAKSQKWNVRCAYWFGKFDKVYAYSKDTLPKEFVEKNERFFRYKRGGGYWIWKSYIIGEVLKKINDGDYLFYCDSGACIVKPIDKLIKVMEANNEEIMLFEVYDRLEREWTKRDIFVNLDFDIEKCYNTNQIMSSFILLKKSRKTVAFIEEYIKWCQTGMLITDNPNEGLLPNYSGFCENRHDQSVLSVLAKKWGVVAYRDPSQWGGIKVYHTSINVWEWKEIILFMKDQSIRK